MTHTIDASGLTPEAVQLVESLVQMLQVKVPSPTPNQLDPIGWSDKFDAWVASQPDAPAHMDDSRESIYESRGE